MSAQFPDIDDRLALCGFGLPDLAFAEACAKNRATVIFEETIAGHMPIGDATRGARIFRMPIPEELADARTAEVRVTLSYFAEPRRRRQDVRYGLDLRWDMQGPAETEEVFLQRVNRAARPDRDRRRTRSSSSFRWDLGRQRRSHGTLQSARWSGPASELAGPKLIAVYPILGWWEERAALKGEELPFSLVVTVRTDADVDVYESISNALSVPVDAS